MKKTCYNCTSFCHTICDADNSNYHMHNWCKYWNTFVPAYGISSMEYENPVCDDLETGDAYCYMFDAVEQPQFSDEWFDANKKLNLESQDGE